MKTSIKGRQAGFAVVEIVLIVIIILAVIAVGAWVFQQRNKTAINSESSSNSSTLKTPSQNISDSIAGEAANEANIENQNGSSETANATAATNSVAQIGDSINAATY